MNFFLTNEQEEILNNWIDEQNKIAIENQLNDEGIPEMLKNMLIDRQKRGIDVPLHDERTGYYSISFTPTGIGHRIYAHHHPNGESFKIQDIEDIQSELESLVEPQEEPSNEEQL